MGKDFDEVSEELRVKHVWLDGEMVDGEQARLSPMTYTLHYGLGAFEGIRAYEGEQGPAVFRLREHIERLFRSAALCRMEVPFSVPEICAACIDTLKANGLGEGYLRPIVFVDDGKRGLSAMSNRVRVAVISWPWGAYLGDDGLERGISAQVSSWARMSSRSLMPKGKICGQYVNSIMAKRDAVLAGFDEAILLDDDGYVSEASGENIFTVTEGVIRTPPTSSPILEGITRDSVLQICRSLGFEVQEERFTRDALYGCDEVFLTGTAAEVTPVRAIDHRPIGGGACGPATARIQQAYFDAVRGKLAGFGAWLSHFTV